MTKVVLFGLGCGPTEKKAKSHRGLVVRPKEKRKKKRKHYWARVWYKKKRKEKRVLGLHMVYRPSPKERKHVKAQLNKFNDQMFRENNMSRFTQK